VAKVTMPQLGESVAEGTIGKWLKKPGDHVAKYEPLLEVITDKVNAEVPSPVEGILTEILVEEGATVPNNAEIAIIETADEVGSSATAGKGGAAATASAPAASPTAPAAATAAAATAPASPAPAGSASAAAPSPVAATGPIVTSTPAAAPPAAPAAPGRASGPAGSDERPERADQAAAIATVDDVSSPGDPDARMTPAVRRLLREHGLTAAMIVGTGGGARITRDDVSNYVETQRTNTPVGGQIVGGAAAATSAATGTAAAGAATAPAGAPSSGNGPAPRTAAPAPKAASAASTSQPISFPEGADEVLLPMTQMRKGIAAQMTRALAIPHAYVQMEVDASGLVKLRESAKREYQAANGVSLSYVPFVVKAAVEALRRNGTFNANWTDAGLLAKRKINIGVAVALDDGLIVPVIRDADQLSIHGINQAIADVAARARANRLRLDDFGGGTFTIDNTGWLGSNLTMPIINAPEVGILTMEAITKRAVVLETAGGDVLAIRPIMNVVLGLDHRANDGAGGAALLRDIKAWLEAVGPETAIY
jgi:2-oxoisovalerate dehydrogenase E2 component (dihydrolipoyl transacylase)